MPAAEIPAAWEALDPTTLEGVILVVGAPDTGKSTFSRYLYNRIHLSGKPAALIDGDPGQSSLGPPACLTGFFPAAAPGDAGGRLPEAAAPQALPAVSGQIWRRFIGSTSPVGHMLTLAVSAARLARAADSAGAQAVIYDTCGLVDPAGGGVALKLAKIDLLQPSAVVAIQRAGELEPLVGRLRRSRRTRLVELDPAPAARRRGSPARREHRARQFARYFAGARPLELDLNRLAVLPGQRFVRGQLVSLDDAQGFALALGLVRKVNFDERRITLLAPLANRPGIDALHPGNLILNFDNFADRSLG